MNEQDLRFEVTQKLKVSLKDKNLADIARDLGITIKSKDGKLNKGWIGQTLVRWLPKTEPKKRKR
jgi:DNA mismatch repair protein MutH